MKCKTVKVFLHQILSTEFKLWIDDISTVWKKDRKINVQELSICFVDIDVAHQNQGSAVAPVFNFAPVPSTVHVFGGAVIAQDDQQQQVEFRFFKPTFILFLVSQGFAMYQTKDRICYWKN
jgi:hypothetical protein